MAKRKLRLLVNRYPTKAGERFSCLQIQPHALKALTKFKMLLTDERSA